MNTPYGLEIIENCVTCKLRKDKRFCGGSTCFGPSAIPATEHVSGRRGFVRGGPDAARRIGAVLGQGQAFDHVS